MLQTQLSLYLTSLHERNLKRELSDLQFSAAAATAVMQYNRQEQANNNRLLVFLTEPPACYVAREFSFDGKLAFSILYDHHVNGVRVTEKLGWFNSRLDCVTPV